MEDKLRRGIARLVVSSWKDEDFKRQALIDPVSSLAALGVDLPPGITIRIVEDSDDVKHALLGDEPLDEDRVVSELSESPGFYDAYAYAYELARTNPWFKLYLKRHPTDTFLRLGVKMPKGAHVVVHEDTPTQRTFVLPQLPPQLASSEMMASPEFLGRAVAVAAKGTVFVDVSCQLNSTNQEHALHSEGYSVGLQATAAAATSVVVTIQG